MSSSGCCRCCTCFVLVVMLLAGLCILLWLIDRPAYVSAIAVSATLSRFDVADGPSGGPDEGTLPYNLTVDIRVRKKKKFGINFDYAEAQASYAGERFVGYDLVEPFYQEKKSERTITAAFGGLSPVGDSVAVRTYQRERSEGFYFVKVWLYSDLSYRFRVSKVKRKSKISCTLRLPVPNTSMTLMTTQLGTTCDARDS